MGHRVCPWWIGYLLASPVRRWLGQDPVKILFPYVRDEMFAAELAAAGAVGLKRVERPTNQAKPSRSPVQKLGFVDGFP